LLADFFGHLSPGERLGEILFGLIMTLTFTLGAGALFGDDEGASRSLLYATLGCNVAWGVIDASLYLLGVVFDRSRLHRIGVAIASSTDDRRALSIVANELDEMMVPVTSEQERTTLYQHIVSRVRTKEREKVRLRASDWRAALVVFWSVVITTLPAAVPFLFIHDPWIALRASNALLLVVLFVVGFLWAKYTSLNPWLSGTVLMVFGVALVALAIALGG